jgi:TM2 domain-containing membrane protein YozV
MSHKIYKNWIVALLLSFFLGPLGVDRFYLGCVGTGVLKLITFGGLGFWALIDFIRLAIGSKLCGGFEWIDAKYYGIQGGGCDCTTDYLINVLAIVVGLMLLYTYVLPWFQKKYNEYYPEEKKEKKEENPKVIMA